MKYIDIIAQTLILMMTLVLGIAYNWAGLFIGQFLLGSWQILSSTISVFSNSSFAKPKRLHLILSTVYLTLLGVGYGNEFYGIGQTWTYLLATVPAWGLAIYYYGITWLWFLSDSKRGKFLPNLSF